MSKILDELELQAEVAGYIPGTPAYDRHLRALKVEKCREMQGVNHCSACRAFLDCTLVKMHLKDYTVGGNDGSPSE